MEKFILYAVSPILGIAALYIALFEIAVEAVTGKTKEYESNTAFTIAVLMAVITVSVLFKVVLSIAGYDGAW